MIEFMLLYKIAQFGMVIRGVIRLLFDSRLCVGVYLNRLLFFGVIFPNYILFYHFVFLDSKYHIINQGKSVCLL